MYQLRRAWSPWRMAQAIARWCGVDSTVRLRSRSGCRSAKAHATEPPQSWPTRCTRGRAECVEQGEHVADQLLHPVGAASPGSRPRRVAALVEGHHPQPGVDEQRGHLRPRVAVLGPAVQQHHHLAGAVPRRRRRRRRPRRCR